MVHSGLVLGVVESKVPQLLAMCVPPPRPYWIKASQKECLFRRFYVLPYAYWLVKEFTAFAPVCFQTNTDKRKLGFKYLYRNTYIAWVNYRCSHANVRVKWVKWVKCCS